MLSKSFWIFFIENIVFKFFKSMFVCVNILYIFIYIKYFINMIINKLCYKYINRGYSHELFAWSNLN